MFVVRRSVVAVVVVVVVGIALWILRGGSAPRSRSRNDPSSEHTFAALAGSQSESAAPAWFAQRDVGARRVAGTVVHDGVPVPDATVRLTSELTIARALPEPVAVTDERGRFDFGPQLAMQYVIAANKPKLVASLLTIDLRHPTPNSPPEDLLLVLHACEALLHGTIRDVAGGVVPGARVARASDGMTTGAGVDADERGAYEICIPVGDTQLTVSSDGYTKLLESITAYGPLRRDFSLGPEAIVVGRVVRTGDRVPVAGAIVELKAGESGCAPGTAENRRAPTTAFPQRRPQKNSQHQMRLARSDLSS